MLHFAVTLAGCIENVQYLVITIEASHNVVIAIEAR